MHRGLKMEREGMKWKNKRKIENGKFSGHDWKK